MDMSIIALVGMIPLGIILGVGIYFFDSKPKENK
jgi:hypothetical protein